MNHFTRASGFRSLRSFTAFGAFLAFQAIGQAEQMGRQLPGGDARAAERKTTVETSQALFAARDFAKGESALLRNNREKPNSFEWHLESASKLTQMALRLRARYDYAGAMELANRALAVLQEGKARPGAQASPKRLGEWHELNGFIHERLLGDLEGAKISYQRALAVNGSSRNAQEVLGRITDAEATHARIGAKGGSK